MQIKKRLLLGVVSALAVGTMALAGGHGGNPAVKARKAHMQLYAHNLGILGGMAKGEMDYNAEQAQAAADNMAVLVMMNQMSYWQPGTSNAELGEETRALPAGWESANFEDIMAKATAMVDAISAMKTAAGSLEGVQGAIGDVGKACGSCHKAYRAPSG